MNSGKVAEGAMVLRAKIDMANPNMHFRDPVIYRIINKEHHITGNKWKAYPMYDFCTGQSVLRRCHTLHLHPRICASPSSLRLFR